MELLCTVYLMLSGINVTIGSIAYFTNDKRYNGVLPVEDVLWNVNVSNPISCARVCRSDSNCLAFFTDGAECNGYSNRMHDFVPTTSKNNLLYYEMKGKFRNLAAGKEATQSSLYTGDPGKFTADQAVDGRRYPVTLPPGESCIHTSDTADVEWWRVDLGDDYYVSQIALLSRYDVNAYLIADVEISVSEMEIGHYTTCGTTGIDGWLGSFRTFTCPRPIRGRFVKLQKLTDTSLCVCEVEVYAIKK